MNWRLRVAKWLVRSTFANPESWFVDWLRGGGESESGVHVNRLSAQQSSAVLACVQVRCQDIGKLPLILYQRTPDGGRRRATEHPLYDLVGRRPNSRQTALQFREMLQAFVDLEGNAYARINRDGRQRPAELIPLHNRWVRPLIARDGTMFYDVRMYGVGQVERLTDYDILHLRERSDDGFLGRSCISFARDVVGLDLAGAKHASKMYANGAIPGGILMPKGGKMGKEAREILRKEWQDDMGGVENHFKTAILGEDFDYKAVGMNNLDAQFVENRKLSRSEVAAIFRVPQHKIGILDNATFSNIEYQALEYVTDTLMPIAIRWEDTLAMALLRESEQADFFFEFMFDALLRGDFKSRMEGYTAQRGFGRSYNEIAKLENWPLVKPEDGGDERLVPLNHWPMGKPRPDKLTAVGTVNTPPDNADSTAHSEGKASEAPLRFPSRQQPRS